MDRYWAQPPQPRDELMLFSERLDEVVEQDALVRLLLAVFEQLDWSPFEKHYTNKRGNAPIHPLYVAGGILYGLMQGIRSSRALEEATRTRVDFMWLLERRTIDHSTFAGFRKRFQEELRNLNTQVVQLISKLSEAALETVMVDGTRIRANSDRHGARTANTLEKLIARCVQTLDERLTELARGDEADTKDKQALEMEVARLEKELDKYREALKTAQTRDAVKKKIVGKKACAVRVPVTDPESTLLPNKEGGFGPNFTPVAAFDPATGAIVSNQVVEGGDEASAVPEIVKEVQELAGCSPKRMLADTSFGTGENLEHLEAQGIEAFMPTGTDFRASNPANRPDPQQPVAEEDRERLPCFRKHLACTAFIYDSKQDCYWCPMGQCLNRTGVGKTHRTGIPHTKYQCPGKAGCPLATTCVNPKAKARVIRRDIHQDLRDDTGRKMASKEGQAVYRTRAPGIEGVFGVIKHVMGVRHFLLRGIKNVRCEWGWVCLAFNLRKLLKRIRVQNPDWSASDGLLVAFLRVADNVCALWERLGRMLEARSGQNNFYPVTSWHRLGLWITN